MGPCQVYDVALIYLQREAEIQTKEKQVPEAGSVEKKPSFFFFLHILLLTIQKGMWRNVFPEING